jgi:nucleoside-diphosphate-sugar epimerase
MARTLVTGGAGFLGRHLVAALLERGRTVRILARPTSDTVGLEEAEIVQGDVTSREDLDRALDGVTHVFHCAAEVADARPAAIYDAVNHRAVAALLDLAHEHRVERLVHTSSYFAVGRTGEPRSSPDQVADEYWTQEPSQIHGPNEHSKYDGEHALNQRVSMSEPVLALMPTMMYGPELRPVSRSDDLRPANRIVRMLAAHARGEYEGIPGSGRQIWNLVHVADVADGHIRAMDAGGASGVWPPPGFLHWHYFLGGENVTVNELFARFGRLAGTPAPRTIEWRSGLLARLVGARKPDERFAMDSHSWAYTSGFAAADLGYQGRPLDEGLPETVEWMRDNGLLDG